MKQYKVKIIQYFSKDNQSLLGKSVSFKTELPFIPFVGMEWKDEKKGIDIKIKSVKWDGEKERFIVTCKEKFFGTDNDEIEKIIEKKINCGWNKN